LDGAGSSAVGVSSAIRSADDFDVLDGELQSKIRENARLHLQLEELKMANEQHILRSDRQLRQVRSECDVRVKDLQLSLEAERQRNVELKQEKSQLESKFIEYLAEMQTFKAKDVQRIVIESPLKDDRCEQSHAKLVDLLEKYELADKRAMSFEVESKILENRLEGVHESLRKARQNNEALQTTVQNYESQLSAMSEYVASLDEKIIHQNDEIETLRVQLNGKVSVSNCHPVRQVTTNPTQIQFKFHSETEIERWQMIASCLMLRCTKIKYKKL
jgi:chromosome segregation ATPase